MDPELLAQTLRDWEQRGDLRAGEGIVVGLHEPPPVEGARRVGSLDAQGRHLVEVWQDGSWSTLRATTVADEATAHVFDELGSLTASRYWGSERWSELRSKVHDGAVLRTAVLLLWPEADLQPDRWDLAVRLGELGVAPTGFWIEDVSEGHADELVPQLRRDGGGWVVGNEERGAFHAIARFSTEADACRRFFRDAFASGTGVSMGFEHDPVTVAAGHRPALREALLSALALLDRSEAETG